MIKYKGLRGAVSIVVSLCFVLGVISLSFAQTTLSPKELKSDTIEKLENVKTEEGNFDKEIDNIIEHIQKSLADEKGSLWIDDWHLVTAPDKAEDDADNKGPGRGLKVFHEEKNALDLLLKYIEKTTISPQTKVTLEQVIEELIIVDRMLAEKALYNAKIYQGLDKNIDHQIGKSEEELAKAQNELQEDRPDKAIKKYEKTWEHAQLALKFVTPEIATQAVNNWLLKMEEAFTMGPWEDLCNAALSLKEIGEAATPGLLNIFTDQTKDETLRKMVAEIIAEIGDKDTVEPLIEVLQNNNETEFIRAEAADTLGFLGDKRALNPLIGELNNGSVQISSMAALGLGVLGDEEAISALIVKLSDPDEMVRIRAGRALAQLEAKEVLNSFVELLNNDPEESIRGLAALWLGNLNDTRAIEPLISALEGENEYVACNAATALGVIEDPEAKAVPSLIEALKKNEGVLNLEAAKALAKIGDHRAIVPLIEAIENEKDTFGKRVLKEAYMELTGEEYQE